MPSPNPQTADYKDQLPKKLRPSFYIVFSYIGGSASILALVLPNFLFPEQENIKSIIYSFFLIFLVFMLLIHVYFRDRRKLHRFSESVLFTHYVNHLVRDHLADLQQKETFNNSEVILQEILNSISQCFSMLTGKQCRCCLKVLKIQNDRRLLKTNRRDNFSKVRCPEYEDPPEGHLLEDNSDFYNLWHAIRPHSRYYLKNNLVNEWKNGRYKNSSFHLENIGEPYPRIVNLGIIMAKIGVNWTLWYKSTLVIPIRYFSRFDPPKPNSVSEKSKGLHWDFWGFLCIDCSSRNVFDEQYAPELGATFADILYIFFKQTEYYLNAK